MINLLISFIIEFDMAFKDRVGTKLSCGPKPISSTFVLCSELMIVIGKYVI